MDMEEAMISKNDKAMKDAYRQSAGILTSKEIFASAFRKYSETAAILYEND